MMRGSRPDTAILRSLIDYNAETGVAVWKPRTPDMFKGKWPERSANGFNTRLAGKKCFSAMSSTGGYQGVVDGWRTNAARIVWQIYYGEEPEQVIAVNGDLCDLRIKNLKNVTRKAIGRGDQMFAHNTSGIRGVYWDASRNLWKAAIHYNGKTRELGRYASKEEAAAVRKRAEDKFGFKPYNKAAGGA